MASKRRIRRKLCERKKRYVSHKDALAAIDRYIKRIGSITLLNAYKCKLCKGWHFGHTRIIKY